jgi:hypothetical protein
VVVLETSAKTLCSQDALLEREPQVKWQVDEALRKVPEVIKNRWAQLSSLGKYNGSTCSRPQGYISRLPGPPLSCVRKMQGTALRALGPPWPAELSAGSGNCKYPC